MKKVEIFTRPGCGWCTKAKQVLSANGLTPYIEYVIGVDGVTKETIEAKIGAGAVVNTVPQIFIDGIYIGGCAELIKSVGA